MQNIEALMDRPINHALHRFGFLNFTPSTLKLLAQLFASKKIVTRPLGRCHFYLRELYSKLRGSGGPGFLLPVRDYIKNLLGCGVVR